MHRCSWSDNVTNCCFIQRCRNRKEKKTLYASIFCWELPWLDLRYELGVVRCGVGMVPAVDVSKARSKKRYSLTPVSISVIYLTESKLPYKTSVKHTRKMHTQRVTAPAPRQTCPKRGLAISNLHAAIYTQIMCGITHYQYIFVQNKSII